MSGSRPVLCFETEFLGPWICADPYRKWVSGKGTVIGKLKDGKPLVGVFYEDFTGTNVTMHIRGEAGWADRYFLWCIFDYPFRHMGCKRVTAPISEKNAKCIKLVENMGFKLECRLEQAIPDGDVLIYRMFKDECRFIGERYAKHASIPA